MLARILSLLLLIGLTGCGGHSRPPEDHGAYQPRYTVHTVRSGDTLYSISFRAGMDYRKVAAANGIAPPYTIYPGQVIRLEEAPLLGDRGQVRPAPAPGAVAPVTPMPPGQPPPPTSSHPVSVYPTQPAVTATHAPPAATPSPVPAAAPTPVLEYGPAPVAPTVISTEPPAPITTEPPAPIIASPAPVAVVTPVQPDPAVMPAPQQQVQAPVVTDPPPVPTAAAASHMDAWIWPTSGPVTRGYSENVHKGIDIGGSRGDPVVAAAAGTVVYAGTGIVGFGELLIIKHNEEYLSAYGHNDRLLVAEGQSVTAGQTIAEKGDSGTDSVKLHFEIRREGKPVDPLGLLPRR